MMNNIKVGEPGYKREFKVLRFDSAGKPILKASGEKVYDSYVYCFEEMGLNRKLMARKLFHLASKNLANLPKLPDHVEIIASRQIDIKALSAILMKVLDDGTYEIYDPASTELSIYTQEQLGKTTEDWEGLLEVQEDFFSKARLQSSELMMQSNGIMMQSINIMKELQQIAGDSGIDSLSGMKDLMAQILSAATNIEK